MPAGITRSLERMILLNQFNGTENDVNGVTRTSETGWYVLTSIAALPTNTLNFIKTLRANKLKLTGLRALVALTSNGGCRTLLKTKGMTYK